MKYRTIIRPEAETEIEESYRWYEDQRIGLGREFLDETKLALSAIEQRPFSYPIVHRNIRRDLSGDFRIHFFILLMATG